MRMSRWLALGASALVLLSACTTGGGGKPTVRIGSDGFYEAKLVTARFFADRVMPETGALRRKIESGADSLMAMPAEAF